MFNLPYKHEVNTSCFYVDVPSKEDMRTGGQFSVHDGCRLPNVYPAVIISVRSEKCRDTSGGNRHTSYLFYTIQAEYFGMLKDVPENKLVGTENEGLIKAIEWYQAQAVKLQLQIQEGK